MKNTITVRFLKKLSKKEIKGLEAFVENPYFNPNQDIAVLYKYIDQFAPNYNQTDFIAEHAFDAVYPNKIFDAVAHNRLMSKLYAVIKKFIHCLYTNSDPAETELKVLRFCNERYRERFDNQLKKVRGLADKEKGNKFYRYTLGIELAVEDYLAFFPRETNFTESSIALDKYYWLSKLPLFCGMLNRQIVIGVKYDISDLDSYLEFLEKIEYTRFPLIELWYCLAKILKNIVDKMPPEHQDYLKFKTLFFKNKNDLGENELRNLYIFLKNIINRTSITDDDYYHELFDLDKLGLSEKLIFIQGQLRPQSIKNILNTAIRIGNITWAKNFLTKYKEVFWHEHADDILLYSKAMISFHEGHHAKALQNLEDVTYQDIFFRLGKKRLQIQIYYEMEDLESFDKHINNFKVFLSRNQDKIGDIHVLSNRDFIKHIIKIYYILKQDTQKIAKLEEKIYKTSTRLLPEKKWLLDKLDELNCCRIRPTSPSYTNP